MDFQKVSLFTLAAILVMGMNSSCNVLNKKKGNSSLQKENIDTVKSIQKYCLIDSFFQSNFYYDSTCNLISIKNPIDFFNDNQQCLKHFSYDEVRNYKLKLPQQRCNSKKVDKYQIWNSDGLSNQGKNYNLYFHFRYNDIEYITKMYFNLSKMYSHIDTRKFDESPNLGNDEFIFK